VGRILRATSLDELIQVFNILKGDMSFIGPRPPLTYHPWEYDKYTQEQLKMFAVRPGITGWAQVNGRKAVEWNRRIELNVWYVEHLSLWLDIKIFFKTIFKVFTNADNANVGKTVEDDKKEEQKEDNAQPIETLAEVAATVDKRADEQEVQAEE
jgi:lipopolysaccharide/colanic/teichoic acid biosynthesis glycosyltransferase